MKRSILTVLVLAGAVLTACASERPSSRAEAESCRTFVFDETRSGSDLLMDAATGGLGGEGIRVGDSIAVSEAGAGKGSDVGGFVGAAGTKLYGLNEVQLNAARYEAYRSCVQEPPLP
jgi:outer membrane lipoprotein SlyB